MPIRHTRNHAQQPVGRWAERGASLVEYALLVALIAVVCIGAVLFLGSNSSDKMGEAGQAVAGADSPNAKGCADARPGAYATGAGYPFDCYDPVTKRGFDL